MTTLSTATPDAEALRILLERALLELHTAMPATITEVAGDGKTVSVQLDISRLHTLDGTDRELPQAVMAGVPVLALGDSVSGVQLSIPLSVGSEGWVFACERAIDNWQYGEGVSAPPDQPSPRHHDLTDIVFLPTLGRNSHTRPALPDRIALTNEAGTYRAEVYNDRVRLIAPSSSIQLQGGNITTTGTWNHAGAFNMTGAFDQTGNMRVHGNIHGDSFTGDNT